ncbi:MAG: hypothetical protein MEP57_03290 [Microvirga sp.]|nr:hypothetical protein [Microvirga sp.]
MTGKFAAASLAGFALALCAAAPAIAEEGDAALGEAAYATTCASCHANASRIATRFATRDADSRDAFLADHYADDAQDRLHITAYLLSL